MHGGAWVWVTGSYDPQLSLTRWGIGNPDTDWNSDDSSAGIPLKGPEWATSYFRFSHAW
jgi:hypothetical protein